MREDTITTKVYPFNELTDEAKQEAYGQIWDINVNYEWWESTYEDAANVGIKLTGFELDRGSYCKGDFTDDAESIAMKIVTEHGESCETYKTAREFLDHIVEDDNEQAELDNDFLYSILEDYRIILQHEYEYLTSEEAIVEIIEANEYEFTADGKLYR